MVTWWIKIRPIYVSYKRLTSDLKTQSEGIKREFPCQWKEKKRKTTGVAIIISDKIYAKRECHRQRTLHLIKRLKQQEDIMIVNIYAPNIGAPKYIKQILKD